MLTKILGFCEEAGKVTVGVAGLSVILVTLILGGGKILNPESIQAHELAEVYQMVFFVALAGVCVTALFAGARSLLCRCSQ